MKTNINTQIMNSKTICRTDEYQTPAMDILAMSAEQALLIGSNTTGPEGYVIDEELTNW